MTLEEQVRDALDELTERVPPRSGLADVVLRRASRRRTVTRAAAAGGTIVAVAAGTMVVVADPLSLDRPSAGPADPADGVPDASPDASPDADEATTVAVDVAELPEGSPPAVPWYVDDTLHVAGQEIPFVPHEIDGFRAAGVAGGGAVVLTIPWDETEVARDRLELVLLSPEGDRVELGTGAIYDFAVSADGALVAWSELDLSTELPGAGPTRAVLKVADATTGEVLHERDETGVGGAGVVRGFLADGRVVLDNDTNGSGGTLLWDPAGDSVTPWVDSMVVAVAANGASAVLTSDETGGAAAVVDTATGQPLWDLAASDMAERNAFSPDGGLVVLRRGLVLPTDAGPPTEPPGSIDADAPATQEALVVADARTGTPVLTIEGVNPVAVQWESAESLVFQAFSDDYTAVGVVRCTVAGECELAAPVRAAPAVSFFGGF